ncbi:MAG: hypothetical protein WCK42_02030 [Myxococcaceae bacterium]
MKKNTILKLALLSAGILSICCTEKTTRDLSAEVKMVPFHYQTSAGGGAFQKKTILPIQKDATNSATGTGSGTITSANDTVEVLCTFALSGGETVTVNPGTGPHITVQEATCNGAVDCIQCVPSGSGTNACSIACDGLVAPTANNALEALNLTLTYTSTISTNMLENGIVRIDAIATSFAGLDFTAQGQTSPIPTASNLATVFGGCKGTAGVMNLLDAGALVDVTGYTSERSTDGFHQIGQIHVLGDGTCTMVHDFNIVRVLTGINTAGNTIDALTPGHTVSLHVTVCDSTTTCDSPI